MPPACPPPTTITTLPAPDGYPAGLPNIRETKRRLRGETCVFDCRLVAHDDHGSVVLYISSRARRVDHVALPSGTVTFAYFWRLRPYNAYHFMSPAGLTLAHYYNVADETQLGRDELSFRDLEADVLMAPGQPPRALDQHKIPADIDPALRKSIDETTAYLLTRAAMLGAEIESASDVHFRAVFGHDREQPPATNAPPTPATERA